MGLLTHTSGLRQPVRAVRHSSTVPRARTAGNASPNSNDSPVFNSDTEVLRLPHRRIAYSVSTPPNPTSTLFFLHGYPSSRLEAAGLAPLATERGIRVVSPDRPGFGQSTFRPYSIRDYPSDVLAVADALGVERFSILGASGGGPYALALAREPRVDKVGLLATAPPWDGPVKDSSSARRVAALLARTLLFAPLAAALLAGGRWAVTLPSVQKRIDSWIASLSPESLDPVAAAAQKEAVLRTLLEPFVGGVEGFTHETRLLTRPWEIPYEEVEKEIRVWHALGDKAAPISMVRPMVARLPRGQLEAYEGGHGDVAAVLPAVLDYFVPEGMKAGMSRS